MLEKISIYRRKIFYFLSLSILIAYYYTPFTSVPIMVDGALIYDPLLKLNSYSEYFDILFGGRSMDLQPLRDLTLLTDIFVGRWFASMSFPTYFNINFPLFINVIIFLLTCYFLYLNLLSLTTNKKYALATTFLFFIHPAIFHIYVEFTARKHILSFLFIQISLFCFLRSYFESKKDYFLALLWYLCCILSQPINALLPVAFGLIMLLKKQRIQLIIIKLIPFGLLFTLTGYLNYLYYKFQNDLQVIKEFQFQLIHDFSKIFVGSFLFLRQIFFPRQISISYVVHTNQNIFFCILFTLIFLGLFLYRRKLNIHKESLALGSFILFLIFGTLYIPKTNILLAVYQNNYLLTPFFAFILVFGSFEFFRKYLVDKRIFSVLSLSCFFITMGYSINRDTHYNHVKYFHSKESNCGSKQMLATKALDLGKKEDFLKYGQDWFDTKCIVMQHDYMYPRVLINSFLIIYSDKFDYKEKEYLFSGKFLRPVDFVSVMSVLNYIEKDFVTFEKYLEHYEKFKEPSIFLAKTIMGENFQNYCKQDEKKEENFCKNFLNYMKITKDKDVFVGYNTDF